MTAKIELIGKGAFATSVEMFVSLLLTRIRENKDIEAVVVGLMLKDSNTEVAVSSMEIRDLVYLVRSLQMYADDKVRENADLDEGDVSWGSPPEGAA